MKTQDNTRKSSLRLGTMAGFCQGPGITALLACLTISFVFAIPIQASGEGGKRALCSKTSKAALLACNNETKDDLWIAVGKCNNLPTQEERIRCKKAALEEGKDAMEECGEQFEAREEVCGLLGQAPYHPVINPDDFLDPDEALAKSNTYFPLVPGTTRIYEAGDETITVTVTDETKEILGVNCVVVHDLVEEDGEKVEDTFDWYAIDTDYNIWYFGEIALNYEDGELVDIEGSWTAGVNGAKPGIIMKADPQVGDAYRQEYLLGDAEDMAEVLSLTESVTVPYGSFDDCLKTKDYTPIEPGVFEHKSYAPGIGTVLEVNPDTGERVELVEVLVE